MLRCGRDRYLCMIKVWRFHFELFRKAAQPYGVGCDEAYLHCPTLRGLFCSRPVARRHMSDRVRRLVDPEMDIDSNIKLATTPTAIISSPPDLPPKHNHHPLIPHPDQPLPIRTPTHLRSRKMRVLVRQRRGRTRRVLR